MVRYGKVNHGGKVLAGGMPSYLAIREKVLDFVRAAESGTETIPSERALCRMYGVSRPTVRRAIGSLIEEGVLSPRRGQGTFICRRSVDAQDDRLRVGGTVGVVFFDGGADAPPGEYAWRILCGILRGVRAGGGRTLVVPVASRGLLAAEEIAAQEVDAVAWISPHRAHVETIRFLEERGLPVTAINRDFGAQRIASVVTDHRLGGLLGGRRLLDGGCGRILFAALDERRPIVSERYEGFREAHLERGRPYDEALAVRVKRDAREAYERTRRFAGEGAFDGVFVADGVCLHAVLNALRDAGFAAGADNLVLYDRPPAGTFSGAAPPRVVQPLDELGRRAGALCMEMIRTGPRSRRIVLPPALAEDNDDA